MIAAILRWLREEARLLCLDTWADGAYHGPPDPHPCTSSDPRCAKVLERQQAIYERMRRVKSHLLDRPDSVTTASRTDIRHTFAAILLRI